MRITCHFRVGQAMVYDLRAGDRLLEVRIEASATPSKGPFIATLLVKGDARSSRAAGPTRCSPWTSSTGHRATGSPRKIGPACAKPSAKSAHSDRGPTFA